MPIKIELQQSNFISLKGHNIYLILGMNIVNSLLLESLIVRKRWKIAKINTVFLLYLRPEGVHQLGG